MSKREPMTPQRELLAGLSSTPADAAAVTGPSANQAIRQEPFGWAWLGVVICVAFAGLSVIGGFKLASDHSHRVVTHDSLGFVSGHSTESDYGYVAYGVALAAVWLVAAVVVALLVNIARDLHALRERRDTA